MASGSAGPKSQQAFRDAQEVLVGGVNSPVRAFRGVGGTPLFFARGKGSRVRDLDGRSLIDYVGSWGPLILGHAHPRVLAAVSRAARLGTTFGAPTQRETELARRIREAIPTMEKVRLVSSGTEAVMSAIRAARAFTGRDRIAKFEGCYHGHSDGLLVRAGSGALTLGVPDSPGIPKPIAALTLTLPFNDLEAVSAACRKHGKTLAALVVEPVPANMGVVLPEAGFLSGLRRLADEYGFLLIFDEIITGFRLCYGGAQLLYRVRPDLTTLGKVVGGGLPLAAYGGRADVMNGIAPEGKVYQAGTLSGNPLAVEAGLATLRELRARGAYERLLTRTQELAIGLQSAADTARVPVTVNCIGSLLTVFFAAGPVDNHADVMASDREAYARFFHAMVREGVYLPPSAFEAWFVSLAHRAADVSKTLSAAERAFRKV